MFRSSLCAKRKPLEKFSAFPMLNLICKLYLFCCIFILISTVLLPLSMTIQIFAKYSFYPKSRFLFIFAQLYSSVRTSFYVLLQLLKRFPRIIFVLHHRNILTNILFKYCYFYSICIASYTLHSQWSSYRTLLLSGDIETNPGPGTLSFCSWNLNSICAHEFVRVSLMEAYNSVYNYDLIGIVETHLDTTVDESKLAIDGYTFIKSNHPQNVLGSISRRLSLLRNGLTSKLFLNALHVKFKLRGRNIFSQFYIEVLARVKQSMKNLQRILT